MAESLKGKWALILGASSGFGGAACRELAAAGINIFGVHLDRKATLPNVEKLIADIKDAGAQAEFFNINAADDEARAEALASMKKTLGGATIHVVLHSLAFGTLKAYIADDPKDRITRKQIQMTLDVMAHSLVYWVQDLLAEGVIGEGSRIFSMTSAGSSRIWAKYGAVSAAKSALESHTRQLAFELTPKKIAVNCLRAGVTDTPSLRKIPGHEDMIKIATNANPGKRLTTPEDVAKTLVALCHPGIEWMTGNVIGVDGGELLV